MTNITKAAQQALAALETCRIRSVTEWEVTDVTPKNVTQAIDALRAALQDKAGEVPDVARYRAIRDGLVYIEPHESGEIYVAGETGVYTKSGDEFDAAIDAIIEQNSAG